MYESPISLSFTEPILQTIKDEQGKYVVQTVQRMGIHVNEEELVKALAYDRWQYEKGFSDGIKESKWIPVTERLPECDLGAEVGNIEWISCGMVHAGCFGRGGKYRDAYFRTWTDAGEGMDAKDADYWRAVTLPQPPKVDFVKSQIRGGLSMKAKYGINPISGGEKMNCANDPVTVLPESELLSATIKCGGTVTCKEYDDPTIKCGGTATCVVSKKEDE